LSICGCKFVVKSSTLLRSQLFTNIIKKHNYCIEFYNNKKRQNTLSLWTGSCTQKACIDHFIIKCYIVGRGQMVGLSTLKIHGPPRPLQYFRDFFLNLFILRLQSRLHSMTKVFLSKTRPSLAVTDRLEDLLPLPASNSSRTR